MDSFYKYVSKKYFVDYENQEVKDMTVALKSCLEDFKIAFNKNENCGVKINQIIPCGSMSEQTTIWLGKHNHQISKADRDVLSDLKITFPKDYRCIEYDFLALLEPLTHDMETVATCAGHAKIKSEVYSNGHGIFMSQLRQNTHQTCANALDEPFCVFQKPYKVVRREFSEGILSTVKQLLKANRKFQTEMETGTCTLEFLDSHEAIVLFVWVSKDIANGNNIVVGKMDFLPAFRTTHLSQATYIVGKHCCDYMSVRSCSTADRCDSDCKEQCWRISRSNDEMQRIKNTSQHHKDLYKIIKVFCDKIARHHFLSTSMFDTEVSYYFKCPTSYLTKTALLYHINDCDITHKDIASCLCETLSTMETFIEEGKMPNWVGTHELVFDCYEVYFFLMLRLIFSQASPETVLTAIDRHKPFKILPERIKTIILRTLCNFAEGTIRNEDFEKQLETILAYPLWDYAMGIVEINKQFVAKDRCDIELERTARIYSRTKDNIIPQFDEVTNLQRSHSESDLYILKDYLDEKNFDENWENIFQLLKTNGYPDQSFTNRIKTETQRKHIYKIPKEDIIPYDSDEKDCIVSAIKDEKDYWYDQMQETFILFSHQLSLHK